MSGKGCSLQLGHTTAWISFDLNQLIHSRWIAHLYTSCESFVASGNFSSRLGPIRLQIHTEEESLYLEYRKKYTIFPRIIVVSI